LYFYFYNSPKNFDFIEVLASLTKESNLETKKAVAVGLHEIVSLAESGEKNPYEFAESIMNILEDPKAWLCLIPGLDIMLNSLVVYFIASCEEAQDR